MEKSIGMSCYKTRTQIDSQKSLPLDITFVCQKLIQNFESSGCFEITKAHCWKLPVRPRVQTLSPELGGRAKEREKNVRWSLYVWRHDSSHADTFYKKYTKIRHILQSFALGMQNVIFVDNKDSNISISCFLQIQQVPKNVLTGWLLTWRREGNDRFCERKWRCINVKVQHT